MRHRKSLSASVIALSGGLLATTAIHAQEASTKADEEAINEVVADPIRPRAVIMISSYLPELFGVCDRIAVMSQGKLTRAVPVEKLTPHDVMLVATGKAADLP